MLVFFTQLCELFPPTEYTHWKKRLAVFPSPAKMSLTKLSLGGNNLIIPGQGEWQRPLSSIHSLMMKLLAQPGEGVGCMPTPFQYSYHHIQSCSVRFSWGGRYTSTISSLPVCTVLCGRPSRLLSVWTLPHFPGWISILYTRIQNVGGVWGSGLTQINTCPKVTLQVTFFRWQHFALPSMSLIFLRVKTTHGYYYDNLGYLTIMALYLQRQVYSKIKKEKQILLL